MKYILKHFIIQLKAKRALVDIFFRARWNSFIFFRETLNQGQPRSSQKL